MTTNTMTKGKAAARRGRPITRTSTVLVKAKAILENGRWTKGCLRNTNGSHCSVGAVYAAVGCEWVSNGDGTMEPQIAVGSRSLVTKAVSTLTKVAEAQGTWGITSLNDRPETKKADVLAVFDEAIQLAKRAENKAAKAKVSA